MNNLQVEALKELINKIDPSDFPIKKGKTIYIGKTIVRPSRGKWAIFDIKSNCMIAKTFCKHSAVALAKNYAKNKIISQEIIDIDTNLAKHYNDCLFYQNIMKKTKNPVTADVTEMRYEISLDMTLHLKDRLDKYIF